MTGKRKLSAVIVSIAISASSLVGISAVSADAKVPARFDNCTNFNKKWPHGVGKRHAHDHTSGTPVRNFKKSNKIYKKAMRLNSDLDRDKDKIACEQA